MWRTMAMRRNKMVRRQIVYIITAYWLVVTAIFHFTGYFSLTAAHEIRLFCIINKSAFNESSIKCFELVDKKHNNIVSTREAAKCQSTKYQVHTLYPKWIIAVRKFIWCFLSFYEATTRQRQDSNGNFHSVLNRLDNDISVLCGCK